MTLNAKSSTSLDSVVRKAIAIRRANKKTPLLLVPDRISLTSQFYSDFSRSLESQFNEGDLFGEIRFDLYQPLGGIWQTILNQREFAQVIRINRHLCKLYSKKSLSLLAKVALTASIARPSQTVEPEIANPMETNVFVVGVCSTEVEQPSWVSPIEMK